MPNILQTASTSRATTAAGIIASLSGVVLALIPKDVWDTCSTAIENSGNPLFTGGLVGIGILLTTFGPSIAKRGS